MTKASWFRIDAAAATPTIYIYDEIGLFGVNASAFQKDLAKMGNLKGKDLKVRINSPGGDVFTGWAIMSLLRETGAKITVYVDGVAASMASAIAMMGDHVVMAEGAMMMIHNPAGFTGGDSEAMRGMATLLDNIKEGMVTAYSKKSGQGREAIAKIMDEETWLTAEEAVIQGFADEVDEVVKAAASFDLSRYGRNPPQLAANMEADMALTKEDLEALGAAIGGAVANANKPVLDAITALKPVEPVAAKKDEPGVVAVLSEADIRTKLKNERTAYAADVKELCALAGMPDLMAGYLADEKPIAEVRADLAKQKTARANRRPATTINNHVTAQAEGETEESDISDLIPKERTGKAIWAQFNGAAKTGRAKSEMGRRH